MTAVGESLMNNFKGCGLFLGGVKGAQFLGIIPGICTVLCVPRQWERAWGFLEQQQPPEGWDTLKLGFRISPGMSRDSGHGFTSPFPSCVPMHRAGMCWIWEDAVSRRA